MSGYLRVSLDESLADEAVELPAEEDDTLLLSVLQSQFEAATGWWFFSGKALILCACVAKCVLICNVEISLFLCF